VKEASDDWQFVASIKGRSGAPCLSSGWQAGAQTIEFDVAQKLRELGYDLNYAELHFAIGLWPKAVESPAQIEFSATLLAQPAVVGCLPVIRTAEHAKEGLPVSAVVTDGGGKRLGAGEVSLFATAEGQRVSLRETDGVWTGTIKDLPIGDHLVDLAAEPNSGTTTSAMEKTKVFTRITDGAFCKYDREKNAIHLNGKPVKPLTGSFQGPFFLSRRGAQFGAAGQDPGRLGQLGPQRAARRAHALLGIAQARRVGGSVRLPGGKQMGFGPPAFALRDLGAVRRLRASRSAWRRAVRGLCSRGQPGRHPRHGHAEQLPV